MKLAYWILVGAICVGTSACAAETDDADAEEITGSAESELSSANRGRMRDVGVKIDHLNLQFTHPQSNRLVVWGPPKKMDDLVDYVKKKNGHARRQYGYSREENWEFWWGAFPKLPRNDD